MNRRTFLPLLLLAAPLFAQTPAVTTRFVDNARSGWNQHETQLSQASVTKHGLVRQTVIPVYGDARGMEASPLIMPAVTMKDGSTHDVMVLPSMADVVRAVDAETGAGLWTTTLGTPITSNPNIDWHSINQHFGCMSTGVLIPTRWYGICWVSKDNSGTPQSGRYEMFALNLADGSLAIDPVDVQGSDGSMWKQRSALTYVANQGANGTIFIAHGSVYETGGGNRGYTGGITAFDVATNAVSAQLPMTAGIWEGGQGGAVGPDGYLYYVTGNGDFDPSRGFYGESFDKVRYTPPPAPSLAIVDAWAPWSDYQRTGQKLPANKVAGLSAPSEAVKPVGSGMSMAMANAKVVGTMNAQGQPMALVYPMASGGWSDEDWGSAGPACIFAIKTCIATGKDGISYAISSDHPGGTTAATVGTAANYAKLRSRCAWTTMSPGPVACDPADARRLNFFPNGFTAHLHATPPQLYDPLLKSWTIFVGGENQAVHKWAVSSTGKLTYIAQGNEYASENLRAHPPGGMTGSMCSTSSNGNDPDSMLLYCTQSYGDANATVTNGRLLVYDSIHLAPDGSLRLLWSSERWGITFTFSKFSPPEVWNGRVYVNNYSGGEEVFGLSQ